MICTLDTVQLTDVDTPLDVWRRVGAVTRGVDRGLPSSGRGTIVRLLGL